MKGEVNPLFNVYNLDFEENIMYSIRLLFLFFLIFFFSLETKIHWIINSMFDLFVRFIWTKHVLLNGFVFQFTVSCGVIVCLKRIQLKQVLGAVLNLQLGEKVFLYAPFRWDSLFFFWSALILRLSWYNNKSIVLLLLCGFAVQKLILYNE